MEDYQTHVLCVAKWLDASFDLNEPQRPTETETVGWITEDNTERRYIVIAGEKFKDGTYRAFTTIPYCLLASVRTLKENGESETEESAERTTQEGKQKAS